MAAGAFAAYNAECQAAYRCAAGLPAKVPSGMPTFPLRAAAEQIAQMQVETACNGDVGTVNLLQVGLCCIAFQSLQRLRGNRTGLQRAFTIALPASA